MTDRVSGDEEITMSQLKGIGYEVSGGIARITLARPEVANAFDIAMAESLRAALVAADEDLDVVVILIDGAGPRFCAGGDVASMVASADRTHYIRSLANSLDGALQIADAMDKPIVAQVQGVAAGAGLAVALSADIIISGRCAKFLTAYAGVGLTPDCGLSWLLPRAIGQQRALELLLTGRVLPADEACRWGLVSQVVDDEFLPAEARRIAESLTSPPFALGQARRLTRSSWSVSRAAAGAEEAETISRAVVTDEARARMARFAP